MTAHEPIDFSKLENTYDDIFDKIEELRPHFLDWYQRERGMEKWPDFEPFIELDLEDGLFSSRYSGMEGRFQHLWTKYPHTLPFMIPEDATDADEKAIDTAARSDAGDTIDQINAAYTEVLDDGYLGPIDALLTGLTEVAEIIETLVSTHDQNGFERVRELFEAWEGRDSDAGLEKFGARLRPAAGLHQKMMGALVAGAITEWSTQLTAQIQLGRVLDNVLGSIGSVRTQKDFTVKAFARTWFGRIPIIGDVMAILDWLSAQETGSDDRPAMTCVYGWFDHLEVEYEVILRPQDPTFARDQVLGAAGVVKDLMSGARDRAADHLETDLGTWKGLLRTDRGVLIPGETD